MSVKRVNQTIGDKLDKKAVLDSKSVIESRSKAKLPKRGLPQINMPPAQSHDDNDNQMLPDAAAAAESERTSDENADEAAGNEISFAQNVRGEKAANSGGDGETLMENTQSPKKSKAEQVKEITGIPPSYDESGVIPLRTNRFFKNVSDDRNSSSYNDEFKSVAAAAEEDARAAETRLNKPTILTSRELCELIGVRDISQIKRLEKILTGFSLPLYCILLLSSAEDGSCQMTNSETMRLTRIGSIATLHKHEKWLAALGLVEKEHKLGDKGGAYYYIYNLENLPLSKQVIKQLDDELKRYQSRLNINK